jgi:hypothetical protein
MVSINLIGHAENAEIQVITRRRIEVLILEKIEEKAHYRTPERTHIVEEVLEVPKESIVVEIQAEITSKKELVMTSNQAYVPLPPVAELEQPGEIVLNEQAQIIICEDAHYQQPLIKRKPTRVPHSPLLHLRRITKLIKKK